MSNGKNINQQDLNKKFSNEGVLIKNLANYINFGIKNSIFNYYDLPVVVLVFMGVKSIGKSTLSNEIALSFFNVSGMRCTEGIWMAISLFNGVNENYKPYKGKCKICKKKDCHLLTHNINPNKIKCICEDCCCNEKCCLCFQEGDYKIKKNQIFCNERCAFPKGHEKNDEVLCCEISPYNHGFICVCLDFECLGTFERNADQNNDLSMIGATMGNSVILSFSQTFDKFTESMMDNWSDGIFCQKDDINDYSGEISKEFSKKINISINRWFEQKK